MALEKPKDLDTGVIADYWRVYKDATLTGTWTSGAAAGIYLYTTVTYSV